MDNIDQINEKRIRKIFIAKIQDKILGFFSSKRFLFIAIISFVYIGFIVAFFIYYKNFNQEIFQYLSSTLNLPDIPQQGLIIIAVFLVICLVTPVSFVLLYVFAVMNKSNIINKILKVNSILYQFYKMILYIFVVSYILFLLYSMFFGLRLIHASPLDYVGFYVVFYMVSIVFLIISFIFINIMQHIVGMAKSMSYNLDGFDDTFVRGGDLKFQLYLYIFINILFIAIVFARYNNIGNKILNHIINQSDIQYTFHSLMFWLIIKLGYNILLSILFIRYIDRYTFYVEIEDIH